MQTVTAQGTLRHRFWGEYSARIGLSFDSPAHAQDCLGQLGPGWKIGEEYPQVLVWTGNAEELQACIQVLVSLGAEEDKIASLAKSIDYGEPFEVTCRIIPQEQASFGF